jgi:hypothetical protein
LRHYRRTALPTESFPYTVLHTEPTLRLSNDTRRFTLWPNRSAHPAVLRVADLDRILSSGADFARKFDPTIDTTVMNQLDRVVAG